DWGRRTRAGRGGALLVGAGRGIVVLTSASAEPIPLPTPAPLPKEGASSATRTRTGTAAQAGASGLKSLFHLEQEPEPAATPSSPTTGFNSAQRAQVDKVSAYL